MLPSQVHPPSLVAQAAGFPDRDNYAVFLGPDPLDLPEFREMALSLWGHLEDELQSVREVTNCLNVHWHHSAMLASCKSFGS